MEQRRAPRVSVDQPVAVTIYGKQDLQLTAMVKSASALGLGLEMSTPAPAGTALKIRIDDAILLGETVHCRPLEGGGYMVGVRLEQALSGLAELARALEAFTESGPEMAYALKHRNRQDRDQTPKK
jgi:hypothetical protein